MVRNIFAVVIFFSSIAFTQAQVSFGVKGGLHTSLVNDNENYSFDSEGLEQLKLQLCPLNELKPI